MTTWQHVANEYANAAVNGVQAVKNVSAGIEQAWAAVEHLTENLDRIAVLQSQVEPDTMDPGALLTYLADPGFQIDTGMLIAMRKCISTRLCKSVAPQKAPLGQSLKTVFLPGDKVKWSKAGGKHAGFYTGIVVKKGPKNYKVKADDTGLTWTIHPKFLTPCN